jgi:hypothetical protein
MTLYFCIMYSNIRKYCISMSCVCMISQYLRDMLPFYFSVWCLINVENLSKSLANSLANNCPNKCPSICQTNCLIICPTICVLCLTICVLCPIIFSNIWPTICLYILCQTIYLSNHQANHHFNNKPFVWQTGCSTMQASKLPSYLYLSNRLSNHLSNHPFNNLSNHLSILSFQSSV